MWGSLIIRVGCCVSIAQNYLNHSQRQLIYAIAFTITASSSVLLLLILGAIAFAPMEGSLVIYMGMLLVSAVSGGTSIWILRSRPIWQAILCLASMIVLQEVVAAIFFPEIVPVAVSFLAVVVLLISLSNLRPLTLTSGLVCLVLAGVLMTVAPLPISPGLSRSLGVALLPVQIVVICSLLITIWLVANRLVSTQHAAIDLADKQVAETEQARAEAERAQAELKVRIGEQQQLIELVQTLETPVISLDQGVLITPLIGHLDTRRINYIRQVLLDEVARQRVNMVVFDITGISSIDTAVARALYQMAQAVHLLGARPVLSGVRPAVAQTLTELGIDLNQFQIVRNLSQVLR